MNVPKLIAILAVIAIAAYCLYGTFEKAMPKSLEAPFDIEMEESGTSINVDSDMNLVIALPPITITSKMPQDFKDVKIDVFMGEGKKRMEVGTFDFGTIPAEETVVKTFEHQKIPAVTFMSYAAALKSTDGNIELPLGFHLAFKYLDWNGTELLDLGITIGISGMSCPGTIGVTVDGNKSTVTVSPEAGSIVSEIVKEINDEFGDNLDIECGTDPKVTMHVEAHSDGSITVVAEGSDAPAYEVLEQLVKDMPEEGLTFNYDAGGSTGTITVTKEQAQSMINAMKSFYETEGA